MRILVLNGNLKRDASDTTHITRAFIDGMRDAAEAAVVTVPRLELVREAGANMPRRTLQLQDLWTFIN